MCATRSEIERAVTTFAAGSNDGLVVIGSPLTAIHRDLIVALAAQHRLPAVYPFRYFATRGGLISYGPDPIDRTGERPATSIASSGARSRRTCRCRPPTKYDLVINLKTAKALGLEVPPSLLARADEVIE